MSTSVFDAVPGLVMAVSQVLPALAHMWQCVSCTSTQTPGQFRACQLNLVIHLGITSTPEQASNLFDTAIEFAQRYPCRLIFLCPQLPSSSSLPMQAKLFSQCYLGPYSKATSTCEALVLAYSLEDVCFLEDQVSVWLENDLPTYYWFHRVSATKIQKHYMTFLQGCRKIIYDSSLEGECLKNARWPRSNMIVDIAHTRLLPMRFTLGQFLSRFSLSALTVGLQQVLIHTLPSKAREGALLLDWQLHALQMCGATLQGPEALQGMCTHSTPTAQAPTLSIQWLYHSPDQYLNWHFYQDQQTATLEANINNNFTQQTVHVQYLSAAEALAEAIFSSP